MADHVRISGGAEENGIIAGNVYDKYGSRNPIVKWMMSGFHSALSDLIAKAAPSSIHEVGCGEGYWVLHWNRQGFKARGTDFSPRVIELARCNAVEQGFSPLLFEARSIYELEPGRDSAALVVCCEVLEHLKQPTDGLEALQRVVERNLIVSVPREPLWRVLNLVRGRYVTKLGNTPGHLQHWSKQDLIHLVSKFFEVIEVKCPLPWTMVLCRRRR